MESYANELLSGLGRNNKSKSYTHKYYWESSKSVNKKKPIRPEENDISLPIEIRGKHYESWKDISIDLGYVDKNYNQTDYSTYKYCPLTSCKK